MPACRLFRWFSQPQGLFLIALGSLLTALWSYGDINGDRWRSVCAVAYSPDGETLAVAMYSGKSFNEDFHWLIREVGWTVALFNARSGSGYHVLDEGLEQGRWRRRRDFDGPSLSFRPNDHILAAGHHDGIIRLWDIRTKQPTAELTAIEIGESPIPSVSYSHKGHQLAAIGWARQVVIFDTLRGNSSRVLKDIGEKRFDFSPDDRSVAVSSFGGGYADIWDVHSGKYVRAIGSNPTFDHSIRAVRFSPDGQELALGSEKGMTLWTLQGNRKQFELDEETYAISFSSDGKLLATGGPKGLKLWNARTGEPIRTMEQSEGIQCLDFTPNGQFIAAGRYRPNNVGVCEASTGRQVWSAQINGPQRITAVTIVSALIALSLFSLGSLRMWKLHRAAQAA
jgi:WD40 repeat protein